MREGAFGLKAAVKPSQGFVGVLSRLSPSGITKPLTEDILQFQVSHNQVFLKLAAPAHQRALFIENDAVTVKDQLVLPTD